MVDVSDSLTLKRYQQLIDLSHDLASILDLDVLIRRIVHVAMELVKGEAASVLLYDPATNQLFFEAMTDQHSEALIRGTNVPMTSIAGWVVQNKKPVIVDDVNTDNRYFGHVAKLLKYQTHDVIAVPMISKNRVIGVLEVLNKIKGKYSKDDQNVLSALGFQAAIAIENSRLFQKSDLISELVHELRTPLTSISAISYMLQRSDLTNEERKNLALTIQNETQRLHDLTTSYLDLSRLESGRMSYSPTTFNMHALVKECCDVIQPKAAEAGISIQMNFSSKLPPIHADVDKIKQVLLNLLNNALKYNHPNGCITIKSWNDDEKITISIQDTGLGIPKEDLPYIFEKFYRVQQTAKNISGTGLGLSICKRIIEGHNGTIHVESVSGEGSTFIFHLPINFVGIPTKGV